MGSLSMASSCASSSGKLADATCRTPSSKVAQLHTLEVGSGGVWFANIPSTLQNENGYIFPNPNGSRETYHVYMEYTNI